MAEINQDWRSGAGPLEIVARIYQLLQTIDADKEVSLTVGKSTAKKAFKLDVNEKRIVRYNTAFTRKPRDKIVWLKHIATIAFALVEMQTELQPLQQRFFSYKAGMRRHNMTGVMIQRLTLDIALTIGVHPWALGVEPDATGKVWIPKDIVLNVNVVSNIIKYRQAKNKAGRQALMELKKYKNGTHTIDSMIHSLTYHAANKRKIQAVVVVEHKNMEKLMKHSKETRGQIVVMTGGYPSNATAEFVHMLGAKLPPSISFQYYSDHDFEGINIFAGLKYGSLASAWASKIQNCPRLQWIGPTVDDFLAGPDQHHDAWVTEYLASNVNASPSAIDAEFARWKQQRLQLMRNRFQPASKGDKSLLAGFKRKGWLAHEPTIRAEVDKMMAGAAKFRISEMSLTTLTYLPIFIGQKIAEYSIEPALVVEEEEEEAVFGDEVRQSYMALPSQEQRAEEPALTAEEIQALVAVDI